VSYKALFPASSGRQKISPWNTRFWFSKIRLTGNEIEIRLFPVRQRNPRTSQFLLQQYYTKKGKSITLKSTESKGDLVTELELTWKNYM
jgi:hypothetical protein